ncbi:hypothetical protein B1759_15845 [Rubrivirga sp. SAORIC476]|uniref:hypothetical protein n=1 Tax=Rubrivirga sp. SAORIC476 TaxID=1961794 RepID=UPI000BA8E3BA|nr:hypothetical protein [Rubrivirga sp. SAORIC476]PAP78910.1 hypothetical protein B1759_15845 [Rubrivirga sp. SAORIC476]
MPADTHVDRDRLLAAARALGLDVDGLAGAPLGEAAHVVRRLALARIDRLGDEIDAAKAERALAATLLWTPADADA